MAKLVVCAAKAYAGVRHRYAMLRQVKGFADRYGYAVRFLWGMTRGVSDCRHEELFAAIPGVEVRNISADEVAAIRLSSETDGRFTYDGESLRMIRANEPPSERFFSWDLDGAEELARLAGGHCPPLYAKTCRSLQMQVDAYVHENGIWDRLGIRVRATESLNQRSRLHRVKSEMDHVLYALYRIPWYVKVFIATDSEYVQKSLLAHFSNAKVLLKEFDLLEPTGRYVHRGDKKAMLTFLKEVGCLSACRKVISIGGFLNDELIQSKVIKAPYNEAAFMHVKRIS